MTTENLNKLIEMRDEIKKIESFISNSEKADILYVKSEDSVNRESVIINLDKKGDIWKSLKKTVEDRVEELRTSFKNNEI